MSRHSVVDVGSNTIQLLVGEVDDGAVLPITGEKVSARLGAGVNGAPSPEILATSAVRDAENGEDLVGCVREATGLKMRLISGEKEAELGFRGALSAVRHEGKVLVVVLGVGSARAILKITRDVLTVDRLWRLSREIREHPSGVLAREHGLAPERARVLPAAITTLATVLEHFGKQELAVARGGIREGTLLALDEREWI